MTGHAGAGAPNLNLRLADGTAIVAPNTVRETTPYVLLEQGRWFEKEWAFLERWLRPGMTAIDIGANAGVYALPMARLVGPEGSVVAFEPAAATRQRLETGRSTNGADNLVIVDAAVSDREGSALLAHDVSSETHALAAAGPGETVRLTTLDRAAAHWAAPPDFIKIDAEGAEDAVVAGAAAMLHETSPVVMFELSGKGARTRSSVGATLAGWGYGLYRVLPGGPFLIPYELGQPLDRLELNLLALKPDRAADLASRGLLVPSVAAWQGGGGGLADLDAQGFAASFDFGRPVSRRYGEALEAYQAWRSPALEPSRRAGALQFAYRAIGELCATEPSMARMASFARAAVDLGERAMAVRALSHVVELFKHGGVVLAEPFWPACGRYDAIAPGGNPGLWFMAAVVEAQELARGLSSMFTAPNPNLDWLLATPFAADEMHRRSYLTGLLQGRDAPVPARVARNSPGYNNGDAWALLERG